jgi:hypothetical protein
MVELDTATADSESAEVVRSRAWLTRPGPKLLAAVVVLTLVAGVAFRLWLAFGSTSRPDGDEAIPGLMALQLLRHGHLNAFYWGQNYGGGLEAIAVAPSLAVFGTNTFGLVFPSLVFGFTASWLTWRIARYFYTPGIAAAAGLLSLFWPAAAVWFGTKERGFYPLTAMLGLLVVLLAVRVNARPRQPVLWLALGLVSGLAWWVSPNIGYYAAPMALWLVLRGQWREWRNILVAAGGLVVGSAVWWYANLHSGFSSLQQPPWAGSSTYLSRFGFFWSDALPFAFGLRRPWISSWVGGSGALHWGHLLYFAALVLIVVAFVVPVIRRTIMATSPDLLLFVCSPFVFATFVGNWHIYEGRYEYFLASILPLLMCRVMSLRVGRAVLAGIVVAGVWTFVHVDVPRLARAERPTTVPMADALAAAGYRTAVANHWIAYPLTFESNERVIASPLPGGYEGYVARVRNSRPAYVFERSRKGPAPYAHLIAALRARHVPYHTITAGGYVAILPRTRYLPPVPTPLSRT